ncbi:DJ-1/PfpI family protein [Demequina globuliformis]|uniref:DJ-1/PfpI family protein n=1 Tax=Demequina globuliformis TaxID=676202 RepID=UPI000A078F6C|nr:DJ-1/PfpI family protein [Demequina globuliformis]
MTMRMGIVVFDGFDVIDAGGPYEVFLTASRLRERAGEPALFEVEMLSPGARDVTAFGGMTLTGLGDAQAANGLDVVVIPGTIDIDKAMADDELIEAVAQIAAQSKLRTSVCTGAFLLARAGLLEGLDATTHWEDVSALANERVRAAIEGVRWVDAGDVVTSGGLTSGMHMALHVVERLADRALAEATARQLDLVWSPQPRA